MRTYNHNFKGEIHQGFNSAFSSVAPTILQKLTKLKKAYPNSKIFITGHSLGAAVAQLTAFYLAQSGYDISGVYLFGSPKVGNKDYAAAYNKLLENQTYVHINSKDLVPNVPTEFMGYQQVGLPKNRLSFDLGHHITTGQNTSIEPSLNNASLMERIESTLKDATTYLTGTRHSRIMSGAYTNVNEETGKIDDHSISQYFYKFACAIVEERWQN